MFTIAVVVFFGMIVCGLDEVTFRDFIIGIAVGGAFFGIIGLFA